MDTSEFDKFADEYYAGVAQTTAFSGHDPEYFARYKIEALQRRWRKGGWPPPKTILDFGAGIGASIPYLAEAWPEARLMGLDVSDKSLALARQRYGQVAEFLHYDGSDIPVADGSMDLIFSACVFHHIDPVEHVGILEGLRRKLAPGGKLAIFEHNPVNPVTQYIVASCVFDENAVLVAAGELARRHRKAGFRRIERQFIGFFPGALKSLRPLEPLLGAVPLGAQYFTLAHA